MPSASSATSPQSFSPAGCQPRGLLTNSQRGPAPVLPALASASGGGSRIRTHGPVHHRTTVFKTAAFSLSAIPPRRVARITAHLLRCTPPASLRRAPARLSRRSVARLASGPFSAVRAFRATAINYYYTTETTRCTTIRGPLFPLPRRDRAPAPPGWRPNRPRAGRSRGSPPRSGRSQGPSR